VTLANNHIADLCLEGAIETAQTLEDANLPQVGVRLRDRDHRYQIISSKGLNIAIIGCTVFMNPILEYLGKLTISKLRDPEHTLDEGERKQDEYYKNWRNKLKEHIFTCSSKQDRQNFFKAISYLNRRKDVDGIIAFIHGGKEYSFFPETKLVDLTEKAIKAGASFVVNNHVHVSQPIETFSYGHNTVPVVWSIGNFVAAQGYGGNGARNNVRQRSSGLMTFRFEMTKHGLNFKCFKYIPTCIECKFDDDGNPNYETKKTSEANCPWEESWMRTVWGNHTETCDYLPPRSTSLRSVYEGLINGHFPNKKDDPVETRVYEGKGGCWRNINPMKEKYTKLLFT